MFPGGSFPQPNLFPAAPTLLTRSLVVLQRDHVSRPLLEPLEERDDEVPDVLRIRRRERVLVALHRRQRERLTVHLASSEAEHVSVADNLSCS